MRAPQLLSNGGWFTVSRGAPSEAIDEYGNFTKTFDQPVLSLTDMEAQLDEEEPLFELKQINELLPQSAMKQYGEACKLGHILTQEDVDNERRLSGRG